MMLAINEKLDVVQAVNESLKATPPFEGFQLKVDEAGIVATLVGGKTWWRVPVVASPMPKRLSSLYDALAEVEGHLQDERGLDILLFIADRSATKNGVS